MALVQEGPSPKTIWSRLYRIPVSIPAGDSNVPFVHVEEDLTVPKPSAADFANYVIYVGFDQKALNEHPQRQRPRRGQPHARR
jgi:hypothetical protein